MSFASQAYITVQFHRSFGVDVNTLCRRFSQQLVIPVNPQGLILRNLCRCRCRRCRRLGVGVAVGTGAGVAVGTGVGVAALFVPADTGVGVGAAVCVFV